MSVKSYDAQFAMRLSVLVEICTCFLCVVSHACIEFGLSLYVYEHIMLRRIFTQWLNW